MFATTKAPIFLGASFLPQPPLVGAAEGKKLASSMTGVKLADQPLVFSHQGDNPVDIMLVGCVYGTGKPVLQKESGSQLHSRQRFPRRSGPGTRSCRKRKKGKIARALGHLRELGEMDMEFKRPRTTARP